MEEVFWGIWGTWQDLWNENEKDGILFSAIVREMRQNNIWDIVFALRNHENAKTLLYDLQSIKEMFKRDDFSQNFISDWDLGLLFECMAGKIKEVPNVKDREAFKEALTKAGITKENISDIIEMTKEQRIFFASLSCKKGRYTHGMDKNS